MKTPQEQEWKGRFGREYTARQIGNPAEADEASFRDLGVRRSELYRTLLCGCEVRTALEVGCNRGLQLALLGVPLCVGVDLQADALREMVCQDARRAAASAFHLPFRSRSFDLVYTSGVLIHIAPAELPHAIAEIVRCSRRYVLGYEYYAPSPTELPYRGQTGLLWKMNYAARYRELHPSLALRAERILRHRGSDLCDQGFVLERRD